MISVQTPFESLALICAIKDLASRFKFDIESRTWSLTEWVMELILPFTPLKSFEELDWGSSNCPKIIRLNLTGDLEVCVFTNPPKLTMLALGGSSDNGFRPSVKKSNEYSP